MITPEEFCKKHYACSEGTEWALTQPDMMAVWKNAKPDWVIWIAKKALTNKELRLFAVHFAREALNLVREPNSASIHAVDVAERFANGEATEAELAAAYAAASAYAASAYAASASADASASAAASAAYAYAYASAAAYAAADARLHQAKWLHENTTPNFN